MYIQVEDIPTHPDFSLSTIHSSILWILQWTIQAPHLFISLTARFQSHFQFHLNIFCNRPLSAVRPRPHSKRRHRLRLAPSLVIPDGRDGWFHWCLQVLQVPAGNEYSLERKLALRAMMLLLPTDHDVCSSVERSRITSFIRAQFHRIGTRCL